MAQDTKQPPQRRAPGLLSKSLTGLVRFFTWIVVALLFSMVMEWVGMASFWPEQGHHHAQRMLITEIRYLDQRFIDHTNAAGRSFYQLMQRANRWLVTDSGVRPLLRWIASPASSQAPVIVTDVKHFLQRHQPYLLAAVYITQLFFVRLALLVLSLWVFLLFVFAGVVDGLVERSLRRQGGGRESSNVYNLARKSMVPVFILACVVYLSLPFSIHPAVVVLPFAVLLGMSVKMTFDKLKKYF